MSLGILSLIVFTLFSIGHGGKEMPEFSDDLKEVIAHIHNECVGQTGVAEEDINNVNKAGIFKDDRKLKCYMLCLLEEANLADEDGVIDYDMMISLMPEKIAPRIEKMVEKCKHLDKPSTEKCQRMYEMGKCCYDADPDLYFLL